MIAAGAAHAAEPWQNPIAETCLECHDSEVQKGDLDIEAMLDGKIAVHSNNWERALRQIQARQMPPIGKPRPTEAEYDQLAENLMARLDENAAKNPAPGRIPKIRRLTRTEYQNAIRDLLALEMDAKALLPADESSHGFDNITVGDLSPALLERYISAAQKISRLAVGANIDEPDVRTVRVKPDITQEKHIAGLPPGTRGGTIFAHHFPRDGDYEIRVRLARDRNEHVEGLRGEHELEILLDDEAVADFKIRPPEKRNDHTKVDTHLVKRISVKAGKRNVGVTFVKWPNSLEETFRQPYESRFNYHRHPRTAPAVFQVTVTGPFDPGGAGETESRKRIFVSGNETEILKNLMRRAWRRPVTQEDVERIRPFFEKEDDFESGIEAALSAILVSREFLFRVESDSREVTPVELASRLSFFLWSSIPDVELLASAESGALKNPAELEKQTRRLLADPRSQSLVTNFADQWLYLRNLDSFTPDGRLFADFDDNLRQAMRRETELLFESVMREDRSVLDLIHDTGETWLNERLAKHYGVPHVYGSHFRKVSLPAESNRGGLLRHGSILTVTSYATRTSPVIRGNWILENLLGTPPPPPPPNVPALEDNTVAEGLPLRERLAAHRENAACASCHHVMDPIGFSLENFDAIGRWRDWERNGTPVDAKGGMPNGSEFVGVDGLERAILERPEFFVRTLTEKLMTYALGRGIEPDDAPAIRKIVRDAEAGEYRFSEIVVGITGSLPFTERGGLTVSRKF